MVSTGVVVIGRNEGERLRRCLASVSGIAGLVVYVDSASTDGSVGMARSMGVEVLELDMSIPFTAARARNAGFQLLRERLPELSYVQFVDGDCELTAGWFERAITFLANHPEVAMVCGRLRERYPERTIYNRLCDMEWDAPVGEVRACGGNSLARAAPFEAMGGFRPDLIGGEEPELCVRLRAQGWKIWRLGDDMALHDAGMTRFGQWWRRNVRNGHSFAEGAFLHGRSRERHCVKESRRALIWAIGVPLSILAAVALWGNWGLLLMAVYPAQVMRLGFRGERPLGDRFLWAAFNVLGKFPETMGQLRFCLNRIVCRKTQLIEYK